MDSKWFAVIALTVMQGWRNSGLMRLIKVIGGDVKVGEVELRGGGGVRERRRAGTLPRRSEAGGLVATGRRFGGSLFSWVT